MGESPSRESGDGAVGEVSVLIAAHNEAAVIGECLRALTTGTSTRLEIIVVPNGCTDDTAGVAGRFAGVHVVTTAEAGKARALNAGERVARALPRIYLDADIVVEPGTVDALVDALGQEGVLVAVPRRRLETVGRPALVKAYFAIQSRLPVFESGLFGRGMIAVSACGRARFDDFPQMVADDLFLDSLFSADERRVVEEASVTVRAPLRTADLVRRLVRVRSGNEAMRRAGHTGQISGTVRPADRWSWLRDVVRPRPWLAPAGLAYVAITLTAARRARHQADPMAWGRDESTRGTSRGEGGEHGRQNSN